MLPKAQYMALPLAQRRAIKAKLGMGVKPRRAAPKRRVAPKRAAALPNFGSRAGRYLGSIAPYFPSAAAEVGAVLGDAAHKGIASVFGQGDYALASFRVRENTLLSPGNTPPAFASGDRTTRVRHREYIGDVFSSVNFTQSVYYINPGLGSTFPWLASVAGNYECYRIRGMLFEYKSMSTNALSGSATSLGTIMMATQYNSASPNFASKQQLENYEFSQSCKPAESMLHYIECNPRETPVSELYVRIGTVPAGQDSRLYDWGQFSIATQGMPTANQNQGELWVTYDIELFKPKLIQGQYGYEINTYHVILANTVSSSNFFPISFYGLNNMSCTLTSSTITFPQAIVTGAYRLTYYVAGTGGTAVTPAITCTSNCNGSLTPFHPTQSSAVNSVGTGSTGANYLLTVFYLNITGPSAVITFSGGTFPTGVAAGDLLIEQVNGIFT